MRVCPFLARRAGGRFTAFIVSLIIIGVDGDLPAGARLAKPQYGRAKRRLADEYDAAQERGEVQKHGGQGKREIGDDNLPAPKLSEIGVTPTAINEARIARDAVLFSVGANGAHGLQRSREDKRNAVLVLLNDPEWSKWSDREIARRCAVGPDLVGSMRRLLTVGNDSEPETRTYTTRHGTVPQMDTSRMALGSRG